MGKMGPMGRMGMMGKMGPMGMDGELGARPCPLSNDFREARLARRRASNRRAVLTIRGDSRRGRDGPAPDYGI